MKQFAQLFLLLDQTRSNNEKVRFLADYFSSAKNDSDKLWVVALFTHRRPSRTVNTTQIRQWCAESAAIPLWLFEENYHIIGDLAETVAMVLPSPVFSNENSLSYWIQEIIELKNKSESEKKSFILSAWSMMNTPERLVFNKLITGGFRVGVSDKLLIKALAKVTGLHENILALRLSGKWTPDKISWTSLCNEADNDQADESRPYPFYLAYPLEMAENTTAGQFRPDEWLAEWKWDGIRCQWILRNGNIYIWSRGEELISDKFPELTGIVLSDNMSVVLDGELIAFKDGSPLDFGKLQQRIGRKNITPKILKDIPAMLLAFDLLECNGEDMRNYPLRVRREKLEHIIHTHFKNHPVDLSPALVHSGFESLKLLRNTAAEQKAEGLMLKNLEGLYLTGRKKGGMWKWKTDPYTVDAVLIYAQRGHGRRANLYSDFTFAVWNGDNLVPFTKAYSGLTDQEMGEITRFVRNNTIETFGPVSSVKPDLVFELAFEGIQRSSRHKSGIALRFPRIKRWRKDKTAAEADKLESLQNMLF
jgi:DNA ligase 1